MRKSSLLFVFLFLLFQESGFAQKAAAEADLQKLMQEFRAVGLSVAVVKKGKLIYDHAFGYSNLADKKALTTKNLFRIASISKSFSATAIMQMVEAGKFSLDDDFSDLIGFKIRNPKYPDVVITLRMVLSHTSSINDKEGYFSLDAINPDKNPKWQNAYNDYAPGTAYEYCNLNYNMTGVVIEKYGKERFDNYMQKHILQPLKLQAGYRIDALDAARFAQLYEYNAADSSYTLSEGAYNPRTAEINNYVMNYSTPIFSPTGGMKISTLDLTTYMQMHMQYGKYKGGQLISTSSAKTMQSPVLASSGYGLALREERNILNDITLMGHTGSAYGLYSMMFWEPTQQYGFVVITNGCLATHEHDNVLFLTKAIQQLYKHFIQ